MSDRSWNLVIIRSMLPSMHSASRMKHLVPKRGIIAACAIDRLALWFSVQSQRANAVQQTNRQSISNEKGLSMCNYHFVDSNQISMSVGQNEACR